MNTKIFRSVCAVGALAVVATIAVVANRGDDNRGDDNRQASAPLRRPIELLHAQRFHVQEAFQHV